MSTVTRIYWAVMAARIGYYAARQAMLKRGASMQDVAWMLVTRLKIEGAEA